MNRATILILFAGLTITCPSALAQNDHPSPRSATDRLRLMLILRSREGALGPEEALTIRLSNEGETTVSLLAPGQLCGDSLDGFVMVYKTILSLSQNEELGRGCNIDRLARTDILAEAKNWKTLAPTDVNEFTVPLRALLLNADGRYELTAKYYPPHLTSAELRLLAANRIKVIQKSVESPPVIVEPQQP